MMEEINYQALFEQLQGENERLRKTLLTAYQTQESFIDWIKVEISALISNPRFPLYLYLAILVLALMLPMVEKVFWFFIRRSIFER